MADPSPFEILVSLILVLYLLEREQARGMPSSSEVAAEAFEVEADLEQYGEVEGHFTNVEHQLDDITNLPVQAAHELTTFEI